jgi:hypothetical protein
MLDPLFRSDIQSLRQSDEADDISEYQELRRGLRETMVPMMRRFGTDTLKWSVALKTPENVLVVTEPVENLVLEYGNYLDGTGVWRDFNFAAWAVHREVKEPGELWLDAPARSLLRNPARRLISCVGATVDVERAHGVDKKIFNETTSSMKFARRWMRLRARISARTRGSRQFAASSFSSRSSPSLSGRLTRPPIRSLSTMRRRSRPSERSLSCGRRIWPSSVAMSSAVRIWLRCLRRRTRRVRARSRATLGSRAAARRAGGGERGAGPLRSERRCGEEAGRSGWRPVRTRTTIVPANTEARVRASRGAGVSVGASVRALLVRSLSSANAGALASGALAPSGLITCCSSACNWHPA